MKKIMCITAIIVLSLNVFVSAQEFTDNYGKPGGAIYFDGNSGDPGNTSFEPTHSNENGGAICFDGNPVNPGNTSFVNTHSSENGGTIYYYDNH